LRRKNPLTIKEIMLTDNLRWLGHAAFRFDGSKRIYFDPYRLPKKPPKADIILVTHEHSDHLSLGDIKKISSKACVIVTDGASSRQLLAEKTTCKEIKTVCPGQNLDLDGVKIHAVASYNTNKHFHTCSSAKLGFIISIDGIKIYHAGDTDFIPEMEDCKCDIALLPVSGTYVMTAEEAAEAALTIRPKLAVPMHYGSIVGSPDDAEKFRSLLRGKIEVYIPKKEV